MIDGKKTPHGPGGPRTGSTGVQVSQSVGTGQGHGERTAGGPGDGGGGLGAPRGARGRPHPLAWDAPLPSVPAPAATCSGALARVPPRSVGDHGCGPAARAPRRGRVTCRTEAEHIASARGPKGPWDGAPEREAEGRSTPWGSPASACKKLPKGRRWDGAGRTGGGPQTKTCEHLQKVDRSPRTK